MDADHRRTPDELLGAIKKSETAGRGRLRIFLGMCPGVGKTFSMLEAAKQQSARGFNVVVGVVETHGRLDTEAILTGLVILPRKEFEHKGAKLSEMDLDQILTLRPPLVLVDELAHTNAPGARHNKRYQDIIEILDAGIDVFTTVNIQHIESRNDQVAQITGVTVRETVPDSFFELADQIEVVDIPPTELLQRLSEGKVYLGDRAARARDGFFKEEHLLALRELSLRFVAEKVDQDLSNQMTIKGIAGPWNTNERLLVAVSFSPYSARLIRTTRRMAVIFEAPWIALYVDTGETLRPEDQANLQRNIALARELGAEVITLSDEDVAHAIQKVSQDRNVTQIIMGRPDRRFFHDLFAQGSLLDKLVRDTSKVDVHVIRAERKATYRGLAGRYIFRWPTVRSGWLAYYNTAWFLAFVSFVCRALLPVLGYQALGSIFLLSILVVAGFTTGGPILFAALMCSLIWDFFFIPPTWTFSINSPVDIMMVISFFVAALIGGLLTSRIKRQETALESRESESRLLYELVKNLSGAADPTQVAVILSAIIHRQFGAEVSILLANRSGTLDSSRVIGHSSGNSFGNSFGDVGARGAVSERELAVAHWCFQNAKPAGWATQTLSASKSRCLPMKGEARVVGVLLFVPPKGLKNLSLETENFIETVITQSAIVLERLEYREAVESTKLYEASEKLHQTLLNSVSHELRTPITALIGTATALKDVRAIENRIARDALTDEIVLAAKRLDRVVENLLDVSRLEKGTMQIKKEWFEVGDLLHSAKLNLKEELQGHSLKIGPMESVLLEGDFQLLEHALTQLILNAVKYGTPKSEIEIRVTTREHEISIGVMDFGSGIPEGEELALFEKFYRLPGTRAGGIGLGLSIVKNIVELHDGRVSAKNRSADLNSNPNSNTKLNLNSNAPHSGGAAILNTSSQTVAVGRGLFCGAEFTVTLPLKKAPGLLREALA